MLFAFPACTFQQAYGSSPQEKQPTEIRPAKTFHADKTLGKYLPVDHPGTAPDGHTDKAHPGRNDMIRAGNNICRPFRHGNTVSVTAKRPGSHRKTEPKNRGETGRTRLMFSAWRSCTKRVRHGLPKHESGNTPTTESPTEQTAPQQPLPAYTQAPPARMCGRRRKSSLNSETLHQTAGRYCLRLPDMAVAIASSGAMPRIRSQYLSELSLSSCK